MEIESFARHVVERANYLGASDVHVLPQTDCYQIYFRLSGQLEAHFQIHLEEGSRLIAYFKFLGKMDVGEKRKPQSGALNYHLDRGPIDLRFSTIANFRYQESLVIRLLEKNRKKITQVAAFFQKEVSILQDLVEYKSGLILFAGPVDSGKTTTMYQLIKNRSTKANQQVISIEDPVEIEETSFLQTQVNPQADITYESLLKSTLRHHPDVIIVGEIRDEETAQMVMRGALTGHLIIASVHAKDAPGVASRLQELGISQEILAQCLIGIVFQKLLPNYCCFCQGNCHSYCNHFGQGQKRAALIDVRVNEDLTELFTGLQNNHLNHKRRSYQRSFNQLIKRAYAYGFISEKTCQTYRIP